MARLAAAEALAANKETTRNWLKAVEAGDKKAMDGLLANGFVNHTAGMPADKDGFVGVWLAMKEMFPAGKYAIDSMVADGDQVVVFGNFRVTRARPSKGSRPSAGRLISRTRCCSK